MRRYVIPFRSHLYKFAWDGVRCMFLYFVINTMFSPRACSSRNTPNAWVNSECDPCGIAHTFATSELFYWYIYIDIRNISCFYYIKKFQPLKGHIWVQHQIEWAHKTPFQARFTVRQPPTKPIPHVIFLWQAIFFAFSFRHCFTC